MPSIKLLLNNPGVVSKIQQWHGQSPAERQAGYERVLREGNGKIQRTNQPGYIIPIDTTVSNSVPWPIVNTVNGDNAATLLTGIQSALSGRTHTTVPNGAPLSKYEIKGFVPARLRLIMRTPNNGVRNSRITGAGYKAANSDSLTQAFGRKSA